MFLERRRPAGLSDFGEKMQEEGAEDGVRKRG